MEETNDTAEAGTESEEKSEETVAQETPEAKISRLERENRRLYRKLEKGADKVSEPKPKEEKPTDLDSGLKALWRSYAQIEGADEWALVKQEMKNSGIQDPEELSRNVYFKQKLDGLRATKANATAADEGSRGTATSKNTVEYWLAKDELPPKELGSELREKYVEAKRNKGKNQKMFFDD